LVVEVCPHVVCNRDHKGSNFREVALIAVLRIKQLELDHLTTIAVKKEEEVIKSTE
jgi:hypothetical protein